MRDNNERVVLHWKGKPFAALVPIEDLSLLEALEDSQDAKALHKAIAAAKAKGEQAMPFSEAKKRLGL